MMWKVETHNLTCPDCGDTNSIREIDEATLNHYSRITTVQESINENSFGNTFYCPNCNREYKLTRWMETTPPAPIRPKTTKHFDEGLFEL